MHLLVRDVADGRLVVDAKTPIYPAWIAVGTRAVYFSGPRPDPGGPPGQAVRSEIPGVWRLTMDGTLSELSESRESPPGSTTLVYSRALLLTPSEEALIASTCRSEGFSIGADICDVEVHDLSSGEIETPVAEVHGYPVAVDETAVIFSQLMDDGSSVFAVKLDSADEVWRHLVPVLLGVWLDRGSSRLVLAYRSSTTGDDGAIATIDMATGERRDVYRWGAGVDGYVYPQLSAGGFAVFGPHAVAADAVADASDLSIFSIDERRYLPLKVPIP